MQRKHKVAVFLIGCFTLSMLAARINSSEPLNAPEATLMSASLELDTDELAITKSGGAVFIEWNFTSADGVALTEVLIGELNITSEELDFSDTDFEDYINISEDVDEYTFTMLYYGTDSELTITIVDTAEETDTITIDLEIDALSEDPYARGMTEQKLVGNSALGVASEHFEDQFDNITTDGNALIYNVTDVTNENSWYVRYGITNESYEEIMIEGYNKTVNVINATVEVYIEETGEWEAGEDPETGLEYRLLGFDNPYVLFEPQIIKITDKIAMVPLTLISETDLTDFATQINASALIPNSMITNYTIDASASALEIIMYLDNEDPTLNQTRIMERRGSIITLWEVYIHEMTHHFWDEFLYIHEMTHHFRYEFLDIQVLGIDFESPDLNQINVDFSEVDLTLTDLMENSSYAMDLYYYHAEDRLAEGLTLDTIDKNTDMDLTELDLVELSYDISKEIIVDHFGEEYFDEHVEVIEETDEEIMYEVTLYLRILIADGMGQYALHEEAITVTFIEDIVEDEVVEDEVVEDEVVEDEVVEDEVVDEDDDDDDPIVPVWAWWVLGIGGGIGAFVFVLYRQGIIFPTSSVLTDEYCRIHPDNPKCKNR